MVLFRKEKSGAYNQSANVVEENKMKEHLSQSSEQEKQKNNSRSSVKIDEEQDAFLK